MTALLIIDMQIGLFNEPRPRHDVEGTIDRINTLAGAVRASDGRVIFIQHDGPPGDTFEPGADGWHIVPTLDRAEHDVTIHKRACDAFCETDLASTLARFGVTRLLVTGCATDFCVDTTVRAALSLDYEVVVVADGHTTADRPHLDACSIIRHHNWMWEGLIHPRRRVEVLPTEEIARRMEARELVHQLSATSEQTDRA